MKLFLTHVSLIIELKFRCWGEGRLAVNSFVGKGFGALCLLLFPVTVRLALELDLDILTGFQGLQNKK